jgi:hypothetical protein
MNFPLQVAKLLQGVQVKQDKSQEGKRAASSSKGVSECVRVLAWYRPCVQFPAPQKKPKNMLEVSSRI